MAEMNDGNFQQTQENERRLAEAEQAAQQAADRERAIALEAGKTAGQANIDYRRPQ